MNLKEKLLNLINRQKGLLDKAKAEGRVFTAEESAEWKTIQGEIESTNAVIAAENQFSANSELLDTPAGNTPRVDVKPQYGAFKAFKNLTEQLAAVKNHAIRGSVDERLLKVNNALGMSSGAGADGGFAVQSDFAGLMIETAVKEDSLLSLLDSYAVSGNADRVEWTDIDETSIASSVFGGVIAYWVAEAGTITASKPKLSEKELKLEKLAAVVYNTVELNADSSFNDMLITRAAETAIRRELVSAVISGNGVGKPIGMIGSGSAVSIAKEAAQPKETIVWNNISKMYNRGLNKEQGNFIWIMHPDCSEQLDFMSFPVGTGGVPVYLPASLNGAVTTLRGKPIIESDQCAALGTVGDILFTDPKQYMLIYKGGIDKAVSIHVQFLTAENCFRFIFRANGMPKKNSTLTIKNSSNARSSIITLATRA